MPIKKLFALLATVALLTPAFALATEDFDGNVIAGDTVTVCAPYGGTVKSISLREGETLHVGDAIATMETTQVLAPEDGTVRGIFNIEGDALENSTVLYVAPVSKYTLSCSISKAYSTIDTKYVRIGEKVYIKCAADGSHKAEGVITAVDGSNYTVQTTAGELYMEETVYIYRSDSYTYKTRIGSGTVGRTAELAITGTGSLLKLHVKDGDTVERGQLLFETVSGTLDAMTTYGNTLQSDVDGVIASVKVTAGQQVSKGDVLLTVYQPASYQIQFTVDEDLLSSVNVGDKVNIVFNWNEDSGTTYQGTVTGISYISDSSTDSSSGSSASASGSTTSSSTKYTGYIAFEADETVRLGMSVTVTTIDE
ncbi:MAG TPA: HlyD family efflux transporter periplasmic adaptor subunit [Candidatus Limiplasma sp.]|nr:HlyD family efflux transporter periplasmic adaptor subunit [Candidatus Limiplasma sp.]